MAWHPNPASAVPPPDLDRPRYLTNDEIESVVNDFPLYRGVDATTRELTREQHMEFAREQLRTIKLAPSKLESFKETIIRYHLGAQIEAGTPVGTIAAESTASTLTQTSLNGAKQAGAFSKLTNSISAIKELLYARKNRKDPRVYIYFNDPRNQLSLEKVYDLQAKMVGSTVQSLLIEDESERQMGVKSPDAAVVDLVENIVPPDARPPWYSFFSAVTGKIPNSRYVLRLRFDVNLLYMHRVTTAQIARALEGEKPNPSVVVVYGPTWGSVGPRGNREAIIDIYPRSEIIRGIVEKTHKNVQGDLYENLYLTNFVIPELDRVRVKGIQDIKSMIPVSVRIWQVVINERRILPSDPPTLQNLRSTEGLRRLGEEMAKDGLGNGEPPADDRIWLLFYRPQLMHIRGITLERVRYMCRLIGIGIFRPNDSERSNILIAVMPQGSDPGLKPGALLDRILADHKAERDRKFLASKGTGRLEQTELMRVSEYVYGHAEGTNLVGVLGHYLVDSTRTYSNDIHRMADVLGIESARKFFIQDFTDIVDGAECYVNQGSSITFIADFSTLGGEFRGVTHHGMRYTNNGFFTRATFQEAPGVTQNAALIGAREKTTGASIAIATGRNISMGTGAVRLVPNSERRAEIRARLRAGGSKVTVEDMSRTLDDSTTVPDPVYDVQSRDKDIDLLNYPAAIGITPTVGVRRLEIQRNVPPTPISTRDTLLNRTPQGAPFVAPALLEALNSFSRSLPGQPSPVTLGPERPHEVVVISSLDSGLREAQGSKEGDLPLPPIPRDPRGLPQGLISALISMPPRPSFPGGVIEGGPSESQRRYSSILEPGAPLTYAYPPIPVLDLPPLPESLYEEILDAPVTVASVAQEDPRVLATILGHDL